MAAGREERGARRPKRTHLRDWKADGIQRGSLGVTAWWGSAAPWRERRGAGWGTGWWKAKPTPTVPRVMGASAEERGSDWPHGVGIFHVGISGRVITKLEFKSD